MSHLYPECARYTHYLTANVTDAGLEHARVLYADSDKLAQHVIVTVRALPLDHELRFYLRQPVTEQDGHALWTMAERLLRGNLAGAVELADFRRVALDALTPELLLATGSERYEGWAPVHILTSAASDVTSAASDVTSAASDVTLALLTEAVDDILHDTLKADLLELGIKARPAFDTGGAELRCVRCGLADADVVAEPCACVALCRTCAIYYTSTAMGCTCPNTACLRQDVWFRGLEDY